MILFVEKWPW